MVRSLSLISSSPRSILAERVVAQSRRLSASHAPMYELDTPRLSYPPTGPLDSQPCEVSVVSGRGASQLLEYAQKWLRSLG